MIELTEELVRARRSVRSFDAAPLRPEHLEALEAYMAAPENPYGLRMEFRLLDGKEHGLKSQVLTGARTYAAAKLRRVPHAEEAFGYAFEGLVLLAQSLGIGTCWIGGTMNREAFAEAMELGQEELMPCVTPLGYPAEKMSIREGLMRKGVKADWREDFEKLFFDGSFARPLTREKAGALEWPLEMLRLAPSAVNKQPWRVLRCHNALHFYEKHGAKGFVSDDTGDLQKVDLGIALCHFDLAARARGLAFEPSLRDPLIEVPNDLEFIASRIMV